MPITVYDLAGADDALRFSPYCWRTRMAIAHKDLPARFVPWRFSEKERLRFCGQERVPVLKEGRAVVSDSWVIAEWLEDHFPERPSLFGGATGRAHARFINAWSDAVMVPAIGRMIVHDVWTVLDAPDKEYFRRSRERRFGMALEAVVADRDTRVSAFRESMRPLRQVIERQPWVGGEEPSYADYIVFGPLQWARCVSDFQLLEPSDPLAEWRGRVLDLFGGIGRDAKRAPPQNGSRPVVIGQGINGLAAKAPGARAQALKA